MPIEVELKLKVDNLEDIEYSLVEKGASLVEMVIQRDHYFAHPTRDYSITDEALRIREDGERFYLTYKGPKFDDKSKTRLEYNVKIANSTEMIKILTLLDFKQVIVVTKERKIYQYKNTQCCLDHIESLGSFIEVEQIIEDKAEYPTIRNNLYEILKELKLDPAKQITESYMELILKNQKE
ncbi:MAG: class IV adenylate cyclase [Candidatus Heimdallarchaeota archaeon]